MRLWCPESGNSNSQQKEWHYILMHLDNEMIHTYSMYYICEQTLRTCSLIVTMGANMSLKLGKSTLVAQIIIY